MSETEIKAVSSEAVLVAAASALFTVLPQGFTLTYRVAMDNDSWEMKVLVPPASVEVSRGV